MNKTTLDVAVVMERRVLANRWVSEQWEAIGVIPDTTAGVPCLLRRDEGGEQWLFPHQQIALFTDEAENYLLNVSAPEPRVFVMWRRAEEASLPLPAVVSVSYGEAARFMDAGEQVDGVPMPADIREWVESFARSYYRPVVKKGGRYASARTEQRTRRSP